MLDSTSRSPLHWASIITRTSKAKLQFNKTSPSYMLHIILTPLMSRYCMHWIRQRLKRAKLSKAIPAPAIAPASTRRVVNVPAPVILRTCTNKQKIICKTAICIRWKIDIDRIAIYHDRTGESAPNHTRLYLPYKSHSITTNICDKEPRFTKLQLPEVTQTRSCQSKENSVGV